MYWKNKIRNRCRHFCNRGIFEHKSMKNRIFVGTSILEAFRNDSMCCAQTAAPEGKKEKLEKMQKRFYCINKSIMHRSARRRRKHVRHAPRALQNPIWPKPHIIDTRGFPGSQINLTDQPRDAQEGPRRVRPRSAQENQRDAQERSKAGHKTPMRGPDPSKIELGEPKDHF